MEVTIGLEQAYRNNARKLKGFWFKLYLQLHGCEVGSGLKCYSFPKIRAVPKANIKIGNKVTFGYGCTLEITNKGFLTIADNVNITQNVLISSATKISIGAYSLIGENVSIRDANHGISKDEEIQKQPVNSEEIIIGKDVWIGANSIVLKGSLLEDGIVIGANSLVNGKSKTARYKVYAGNPVQFIKDRK